MNARDHFNSPSSLLRSERSQLICSSLACLVAILAALWMSASTFTQQPPQPSLAQQLRGLRGFTTVDLNDEQTAADAASGLSFDAQQPAQPAIEPGTRSSPAKGPARIVATAHHQVRRSI